MSSVPAPSGRRNAAPAERSAAVGAPIVLASVSSPAEAEEEDGTQAVETDGPLASLGESFETGARLVADTVRAWPIPSAVAAGVALLLGGALWRRRRGRAEGLGQLQHVLEALPDAVALFDARGKLRAFNEKLLGLLPTELAPGALEETTPAELYARLSPDAKLAERARGDALEATDEADATLTFELPSYGRRSLLVRERPGADGGTLVSVYGGDPFAKIRYSDPLTALANRARLVDELAKRCSDGRVPLALLIVDLRSFRQLNDTYGRAAGDQLLKQTALCLRRNMPREALIARIAGDEFGVLLDLEPGRRGRERVERRVATLLTMLRRGLNVESMNVPVRASVGIAYAPDHGTTVSTLLGAADSACAHAKRLGNNALVVFNSRRQQEAKHRHQLEVGLQQAIGRGELSLQYQPQVDIRSKMTCGMEALLRWEHPEFGRVPPADFIPIAEQTGIITRVGSWVLRQAIEDYQRLAQFGMSPAMLSINLSRKQFDDGRIVHEIGDLLEQSGFDPAKLCLEITETALFSDSRRLRELLSSLTGLGARLAIDDFGVGYSSLLELKDFPIGEVKIDRAFVTDVATDGNCQDIIRAVVSIADSIGAEVVAEGIENQAQFDMITALGCDRGQGYWLCEPMPATTFPDVVLSA